MISIRGLILMLCIFDNVLSDSLFDWSTNDDGSPHQLTLNEWDSSLYGKPVCVNIPSNMSLCNNINYKQMKVPNLLGHESVSEIEYQSSVWLPLVSINCHPDTQLFLCSLFAPVCLEQMIYPCRSLCESVKNGCEAKMNAYSYQWPDNFDCSKFPEDNGLCIQPSNSVKITKESTVFSSGLKQTTSAKQPIRTTTTELATHLTPKKNNRHKDKHYEYNSNYNVQCHSCGEKDSMDQILENFCRSNLVLKARIQSFEVSNLQFVQKNNRQKVGSRFISVSRQNRKILKGDRIMRNLKHFLTGRGNHYKDPKRFDVFLLSQNHLNMATSNNKRSMKKHPFNVKRSGRTGEFCKCRKLRQTISHKATQYLIMARSIKVSNFYYFNKSNQHLANNKKRQAHEKERLLYLTYIVPWQKAKKLVKFIDQDFDKNLLCKNRTIIILGGSEKH